MRIRTFRIADLLLWTFLVALLCASYVLAPWVDPLNARSTRATMKFCIFAALPFAFLVSLVLQRMSSSRMWTSFLLALLVPSWAGFAVAEALLVGQPGFQGMGALVATACGMIVSLLSSLIVPCFFPSLRFNRDGIEE
jgi:hypothetical protein